MENERKKKLIRVTDEKGFLINSKISENIELLCTHTRAKRERLNDLNYICVWYNTHFDSQYTAVM